jgi:aminoglycoside phosphotransferase (APT) family kinase protein
MSVRLDAHWQLRRLMPGSDHRMSDLRIYLENVLLSLQQEVTPALTTERGRTSVKAITNIVARVICNLRGAEEAGGAVAALDTPEATFGGDAALASAARQATERLARTGAVSSLADLVRWEHDILSPLQSTCMDLIAGPSRHDTEGAAVQSDSGKQLEAYLQRRFGQSARVSSFHDLFGGRSKITSLARITDCPGVTGEFAIRRDATVNLTGGRSVIEEYPILQVLHEHGVRVPRPVLAEPDRSVLGTPFILVERLPGACGEIYRTPGSVALLKDVAALLARFHSVPLSAYAKAGAQLPLRRREDIATDIAGIERTWTEGGGPNSVAMSTAFDWLRRNLDRAFKGDPSLAHCDVRFHNILFEGNRVTGLLDWELARASYPAEDLGYIRPTVCRLMPWEDFMAAYASAGGPSVAEDQIDFYAIFCAARFAALSAAVKKIVVAGQSRDIQLTAVPVHDLYIWIFEISEHLLRVAKYS